MFADFLLLDEFVPEKEIKSRFYDPQLEMGVIYLRWFRQLDEEGGYNRFADVFISKEYSLELVEKMGRKRDNLIEICYTA